MNRRDETGFRHGLRVRMGATGQKGQLLRCEKRDGTGHYWKVKLSNGQWVWPDGIVIDGTGQHMSHCHECRLPFMGSLTDLLCQPCQDEVFGTTTERAQDASEQHFARRGTHPRRRSHF